MEKLRKFWLLVMVAALIMVGVAPNAVADDSDWIQQAIDEDGYVILPTGDLYLDEAIEITKDDVVIRGLGRGATVLHLTADTNAIEITSEEDEVLRGIELRDFGIDGHDYEGNGLVISAFDNSVISNLHIHNVGGCGIISTKSGNARGYGCVFENLEIQNCGVNGVEINDSPEESEFRFVRVRNVGGYQFKMVDAGKNHISSCHFGGTNGGNAVLYLGGWCYFTFVEETWFSGLYSSTNGVYIDPIDAYCWNVNISGCIFKSNYTEKDAVYLTSSGDNNLTKSIINDNTFDGWRYAVNFANNHVRWCLATGNMMVSCGTYPYINDDGWNNYYMDNLGAGVSKEYP